MISGERILNCAMKSAGDGKDTTPHANLYPADVIIYRIAQQNVDKCHPQSDYGANRDISYSQEKIKEVSHYCGGSGYFEKTCGNLLVGFRWNPSLKSELFRAGPFQTSPTNPVC
jgi:hypothetical protein